MKKTYQKPGIYVENFGLSQSIAATCGAGKPDSSLGQPLQDTKQTCGWGGNGISVWLTNPPCQTPLDEDSRFGDFCYNNPNGGLTIFGWS